MDDSHFRLRITIILSKTEFSRGSEIVNQPICAILIL
jgi:hypothetical protein